jgi:pyrroline-5-carboxylate reductase
MILPDLQAANLHAGQVLISVAAGIPLRTYEQVGEDPQIVRALPNPPSQVGQGIAPVVFSSSMSPENRRRVMALFAALGEVVEVDETYLDAITSLSSPVATYVFLQALIEAGIDCGLTYRLAEQVAAQTIIGSMAVWRSRMVPPTELIEEASTPGGVSVESVRTLAEAGFKRAISAAIMNGAIRSKELGKAAGSV